MPHTTDPQHEPWLQLERFVLSATTDQDYALPFYHQLVTNRGELVQVYAVRLFSVSPTLEGDPLWEPKLVVRCEGPLSEEPVLKNIGYGELPLMHVTMLVNALQANKERERPSYLQQYPTLRESFNRIETFAHELHTKKIKIYTVETPDNKLPKAARKQLVYDLGQLCQAGREILEEQREHELIHMFAGVMKQHSLLGHLLESKGPESKFHKALEKQFKAIQTTYQRYWFYVSRKLLPASEPLPEK
jgi:hypothetical protein